MVSDLDARIIYVEVVKHTMVETMQPTPYTVLITHS